MLRVGQEKLKLEQDMTTDEGECRHTNFFRPTGHRKRERIENQKCLLSLTINTTLGVYCYIISCGLIWFFTWD